MNRNRRISCVILGAGGHARSVIDALRAAGTATIRGVLDTDSRRRGEIFEGVPVLGGDNLLPHLRRSGVQGFLVGVGSTGDAGLRRRLYRRALRAGLHPLAAVHPSAVVSTGARVGPGAQILAGSVINAGASLGVNVIVNSRAVVEHDCAVGDHAHIATGAILCGGVLVDAGALIGAGSVVLPMVSVGAGAVIGAGAVVLDDVPPGARMAGVPARPLSRKNIPPARRRRRSRT